MYFKIYSRREYHNYSLFISEATSLFIKIFSALCPYPAHPIRKEREKALSKKINDGTTVNSMLIRRPMKKWFPLFILPTFLCFIIGFIWPFIQGIYLSFCNFLTPVDAKWVGFENYVKAFQDPSFARAFWNTSGFAVVSIILINVCAFAIAYALTQKMRGSNLFRTVFFMPNLIGGVVLGYIWSMIFDAILKNYGGYLVEKAEYGFWGLVILVAWQQMLEAAKIDGANSWQTLFQVIIPNVMPSVTICTFLTLTNSFKMFDQNMALTGGLPITTLADGSQIKATELLALNIYSTYNINKNWHGVAQAKAVVFFILVAVLAIAQLSATRKKEVQQ